MPLLGDRLAIFFKMLAADVVGNLCMRRRRDGWWFDDNGIGCFE